MFGIISLFNNTKPYEDRNIFVIYRITEYGITPNKITLLGTNIIMLGHLLFIVFQKYKQKAEKNLQYLPIYFIWAIIVVFIFPLLFKYI